MLGKRWRRAGKIRRRTTTRRVVPNDGHASSVNSSLGAWSGLAWYLTTSLRMLLCSGKPDQDRRGSYLAFWCAELD